MLSIETTASGLERAIHGADQDSCIALLSGLTEAERRALLPAVLTHCRSLQELVFNYTIAREDWSASFDRAQCAYLALYGTGSFAEIKKHGHRAFKGDRLYDVLVARRPAWLDSWIAWTLEADGINWAVVRRLVREGICRRPEPDTNYCLWMIPQQFRGVRETLESDPELLEYELWRLFEIEGRRDVSLAQNDKYFHGPGNWFETLIAFASEGRIDRKRLLVASLAALQRRLPQFQAGWFSRFHEALRPSIEERVAFVGEYLHLLSSPIPPTVSFALTALALIDKAQRLDAATFLDAVRPALYSKEKKSAAIVLKILVAIAGHQPALRDRAADAAATLLEHPAVDIQEKALEFLKGHCSEAQLNERFAAAATVVAPSLRARLPAQPPVSAPQGAPCDSRIRSVPEKWLRMAGIRYNRSVDGLDLLHPDIPRLHAGNQIQPITTLEELVRVYLRVLETDGPPDDIERVLDGVARLCTHKPDGFDRFVSPLLKRARQLIRRSGDRTPAQGLSAVVLAWIAREQCTINTAGNGADAFLASRLKALADRVIAGVCQPLTSAPTHAGGWIDRSVFRERLAHTPVTDEFDRTLAELRCYKSVAAAPSWVGVALRQANFIRWAATIAPNHRDVWFRTGATSIAKDLDWWETHWDAKAYLEAVFDPDAALGDSGMLLIVFGVASKEAGEATLATDALVASIEDGRIVPEALGETLTSVILHGPTIIRGLNASGVKIPRIVKRLRAASQVSALHAATIYCALHPVMRVVNTKPLRELYADLKAECADFDLAREQLRIRLDRAERWANAR